MGRYIVIALLIIFLVYMLVWTFRLQAHTKRQNKINRIRELKEKKDGKSAVTTQAPETQVKDKKPAVEDEKDGKAGDYWVNLLELKECTTEREKEKCYHYFNTVDEGFHGLLLEIYDYGLVRIDELETIAYGKTSFDSVDLSFLDELEEDIVRESNDVMDAVKELDQEDPGITDIKGTLSEGVEKVIKAVDKEKEMQAQKSEPISVKEEKSVEKARSDRAKTSNQEIRNKIFLKWDHYVDNLYEMIDIKASDDTKRKIKKALRDYGYNDVDVLLKSPE